MSIGALLALLALILAVVAFFAGFTGNRYGAYSPRLLAAALVLLALAVLLGGGQLLHA